MGFITKDTNTALLTAVVIVLVAAGGMTFFYNTRLTGANTRINAKTTEALNLSTELSSAKTQIDSLEQELGLKQEREQSFTQQFLGIRSERETLKSDITVLEGEKKDVQRKLADTRSDLDLTTRYLLEEKTKSDALTAEKRGLQATITVQDKMISDLAKQIAGLEKKLTECKNASSS